MGKDFIAIFLDISKSFDLFRILIKTTDSNITYFFAFHDSNVFICPCFE